MIRRLLLGMATLAVAASCRTTPAPLGEALVVVQTDVAVPGRVGRVRVDVHDASGVLLETREVVTPTAQDWPVSFSVTLPEEVGEADVLVRLRAYGEGHTISARDLERFARAKPAPAAAATSIDALCKAPPALALGERLTLRRGATALTTVLRSNHDGASDCERPTAAGSIAARLEIRESATYQIEVVGAVPDGARGVAGGDTTLSVRTACPFATSQIACADDISVTNKLSRLVVDLQPGTYFVVTGGDTPAPADLTLLASRSDAFQEVSTPPTPPLSASSTELAPEPGVVIDRLVAIHLRAGERGDVPVTLHGECFGAPADLGGRTTCIDTTDSRSPVTPIDPRGSLTHELPPLPATWIGDAHPTCTATPRSGGALLDGEACIPGGAFVLGDTLALVDLDQRAQPERMRVVEPFLLDVYEMTVGRYRDAVRRGFHSPDATPREWNGAKLDPTTSGQACTWNRASATSVDPFPGTASERETYPLNCISWTAARALCQFLGGDLPTEDQWEYAATAATPGPETPYPWGREVPDCNRTVFARFTAPVDTCAGAGLGPTRVDDPLLRKGDISAQGVVALGGNVQEWLSTAFVPYADPAWERAGMRARIDESDAPLRAVRGADWSGFPLFAAGSSRRSQPAAIDLTVLGLRCARAGQ